MIWMSGHIGDVKVPAAISDHAARRDRGVR